MSAGWFQDEGENKTLRPVADLLGVLHGISCPADVIVLESHHGLHFQHRGVDKGMVHALVHSAQGKRGASQMKKKNSKWCWESSRVVSCSFPCWEKIRVNTRWPLFILSALAPPLVLRRVFILQRWRWCWNSQTLGVSFGKQLISWRSRAHSHPRLSANGKRLQLISVKSASKRKMAAHEKGAL